MDRGVEEVEIISIHAPVKGATRIICSSFSIASYFNPRSREGSDFKTPFLFFIGRNFNPRSREGSDLTLFL